MDETERMNECGCKGFWPGPCCIYQGVGSCFWYSDMGHVGWRSQRFCRHWLHNHKPRKRGGQLVGWFRPVRHLAWFAFLFAPFPLLLSSLSSVKQSGMDG